MSADAPEEVAELLNTDKDRALNLLLNDDAVEHKPTSYKIQLPKITKKVDVCFREMKLTDLKSVKALNEQTLPENYPESFWQQKFATAKGYSFVATYANQIIGYVFACDDKSLNMLYIMSFAVAEVFRRHGVGKELINRVILCDRNIILHVRESNQAVKFYTSCGFNETSIIEKYYSKPEENAVEMFLLKGSKPKINKFIKCVV